MEGGRHYLGDGELHVALPTADPHVPKQHIRESDVSQGARGGCDLERSDVSGGRQRHQPTTHGPCVWVCGKGVNGGRKFC